MEQNEKWSYETLGKKTCEELKKNFFDAQYVSTSGEALDLIKEELKKAKNVAFGGSMTIDNLGVREAAAELGIEMIDQSKPGLSMEEMLEVMRAELTSDLFLASSNAVTLDGKLFNVDMTGNRLAAMIFGPRKVMLVVGANKIVRDEQDAHTRLELVAGPRNSKRLGMNNPWAVTGICSNCNSETRICRAYQVLRKKPAATDFTVIIVGEAMGL